MGEHPNIVKMYEYGIKGVIVGEGIYLEGLWFIVLEYISERTMFNLIKCKGYLRESIARYFFKQMINTLIFINSK